ncbi:MAG: polyribonucleotide nucleotidyltransferase [Candidatus Wolfebacteria bacterium]|nr:polyribonucleotide nucleotidyltransferase [Candidatus Wolfebacteria bacterium]
MLESKEFSIDFQGKPLSLKVSKIAEQANSAVLGQYGDTVVLVTATMGEKDRDTDYFPLVVDYEEKFYAAGKIIGSRFIRREGRPSEEAILSGRMIDRALRPFFNSRMRRDVQIVITILSYDEENDPDFISLLSASTALAISDIPWNGPVAGVRLAKMKGGNLMINPTKTEISGSEFLFESFVAGNESKINMIELAANEVSEKEVISSFETAQEEIKKLIKFQKEIIPKISKPKAEVLLVEPDPNLKHKVQEFLKNKLENAVYVSDKAQQRHILRKLKEDLKEHLVSEGLIPEGIDAIVEEEIDALIHKNILEKDMRPDSRKLDEVRALFGQVGLFKRLHGSALFFRGSTQSLAVTTLAAPGQEQMIETMEVSGKRRFMLHYNFPPYSVGEIGRLGGPGRREVGHGALAEKAIRSIIPSKEEFPYTIRVVSEILSSNGSSSMATVCSSVLSLMDAGVPIKKPVAGIAMGIIMGQATSDKRQDYKVLTDIQGPEDHYGDMDCKVAGTTDGITAIQMDVKIDGVTTEILNDVLVQAKKARLEILEVMKSVIDKPREKLSEFAPIILTINISPERIGEVIGPGGKMINMIIKDTGVTTIDIEQTGKVFVSATTPEQAQAAIGFIQSLTKEFEVGEIIEGKIIKLLEFGAIVDLGGGNDGMIHISEVKSGFVKDINEVLKLGDVVRAKIIKVENGKIGLSIKALAEQK